MASCVGCFFSYGRGGCHRSLQCLSSSVMIPTHPGCYCKRSFLAHNNHQQPGSWTSTWPPAAAQEANLNVVLRGSTDHARTSAWLPVAAQITDITMVSCEIRMIIDINMASGGRTDCRGLIQKNDMVFIWNILLLSRAREWIGGKSLHEL